MPAEGPVALDRSTRAYRATDAILAGSITFFGVWTLLYQMALLLRLDSRLTLGLTVLVWAGLGRWLWARSRTGRPDPDGRATFSRTRTVGALWAAAIAAVVWALAFSGQRALALTVGLVAAAAALWRTTRAPEDHGDEGTPPPGGWYWLIAWGLGLASAAVGSLFARPDGDDAYFLNFTVWVRERNSFPLRDTMISQEVFPAIGGHSPPVHSIEGLLGTFASVLGLQAGTVTYLVASPLFTVLAVLVLAVLVAHVRILAPEVALVTAVAVLWLSGSGASHGTFFALRMWQGKSVLLMVALPLVLLAGLRLLDRPRAAHLAIYVAAVVASIGASNSAVFLTPLLLAALTGTALLLRRRRAAVLLALPVLYPLVIGLIVLAMSPPPPSETALIEAGLDVPTGDILDPLFAIPSIGGLLVVFVLALCLGWLGAGTVPARATLLATIAVGTLMVVPPVSALLSEGLGIGAVVWRFWWVVPLPLLLAGVVGVVAGARPEGSRLVRYGLAGLGSVALLVPLVLGANWVADPDLGVRRVSPTSWKVPPGALSGAVLARDVSRPGDTVLAPWDVSRVLAGLTVEVNPVSARAYYLPSYVDAPGAHVLERARLQEFADETTPADGSLDGAFDIVGVDTACVATERDAAVELLREAGFVPVGSTSSLTCMRRG